MTDKGKDVREVPDVIVNTKAGRRYLRGKFLGKGGFARCYELIERETEVIYAGKIVSKTLLTKKHQKEKMAQEIEIHRGLRHDHVVGFVDCFEDRENVYVLLELCKRRSLMELHKRRRAITEPEARYFVRQVVEACIYLHEVNVIHRDLKLGNLFLNDEMKVKVGDFGLATKLDYAGERKRTLCGTPNYIAPEMLNKKGHSFEVDTWAIGCILYTLLVGKPPFETQSLKETYIKIKKNDFHVPSRISENAKHLIMRLLAADPTQRPTVHDLLGFEFFSSGYLPTRLPHSCLTMAPKFPSQSSIPVVTLGEKRVLSEVNKEEPLSPKERARKDILSAPVRNLNNIDENTEDVAAKRPRPDEEVVPKIIESDLPNDFFLSDLFSQLRDLLGKRPADYVKILEDEAEDPAATPIFWISKWVDYSDKYGLGYQLCDNSVGVLFNDSTKLVLDKLGENVQFIDRENKETFFKLNEYPQEMNKKITLLKYFRDYMQEHLLKAGEHVARDDGDDMVRLPALRTWFRTRSAIVLHLTNGTLQLNFFQDHTKIILCPLMGAVTFIDEKRNFRTFRFTLIEKFGCGKDLANRLRYARQMVERLMNASSSSRPGALSTATVKSHQSNNPSSNNMISSGSKSPMIKNNRLTAPSSPYLAAPGNHPQSSGIKPRTNQLYNKL